MAGDAGQLDTSIKIVTPENIAFQYRVAGPFRRLPAYLIDVVLRLVIALVGTVVLLVVFGGAGLGAVGFGGALVLWFFLSWFYGGVFETYWNGQTPGKRMMQIRVLSAEGQPITGLQAVMRNLLRVVDAQPLGFYQLGLIAATLNDRFQRLGDLACGTMVVIEEPQWLRGLVRTDEPDVRQMAERIPAPFQPSRTLTRALAAYVQRRQTFSWGRRLEIARHLAEPLRQQFDLPPDTNPDLLLCGLYHRTFITEGDGEGARAGSPFREPQSPFAAAEKKEEG